MNVYTPDYWNVLRIQTESGTLDKVIAGWVGGYLYGDSWRMNSGITETLEFEEHYEFKGESGSVYVCPKSMEGVRGYAASILSTLIAKPHVSVILAAELEVILDGRGCAGEVQSSDQVSDRDIRLKNPDRC